MKVGKTGQQVHFIFVVQKNKIIAHGRISAVNGENLTTQIQKRPAKYRGWQKKS